jgi:hypothetical protein
VAVSKKRKDTSGDAAYKKVVERGRVVAERQAIRLDLNRPGDPGFGTSPASMGAVKMASEEALMTACSECGYSAGRHAKVCSRA